MRHISSASIIAHTESVEWKECAEMGMVARQALGGVRKNVSMLFSFKYLSLCCLPYKWEGLQRFANSDPKKSFVWFVTWTRLN